MLNRLSIVLVLCVSGLLANASARAAGPGRVTNLRVEYLSNPLGIDAMKPRFSWVVESGERGTQQQAYRILVASSAAALAKGNGDVWDTGRVTSPDNAQVEYAGPALESRRRYHYEVVAWDQKGRELRAERAAFFEMGMLEPSGWRGRFIGMTPKKDDDRYPFAGGQWIWAATAKAAPAPKRVAVRHTFTLAPDERVRLAELALLGPGQGKIWEKKHAHRVWLNGKRVRDFASGPGDPRFLTVTPWLQVGENQLAIQSPQLEGAALTVALRLELADGRVRVVRSDGTWRARSFDSDQPPEAWLTEATDQAPWTAAEVRGAFGDVVNAKEPAYRQIDRVQPAIYLRKAFQAPRPVERARLYVTAAGIYEAYVNGKRVGRDVFTPGWTDYGKRLRYQTYDVTNALRKGENVVGGIVAEGWFSGRTGMGTSLWGFEKALLGELHVDYQDGSHEVIATDDSWRASTGPIRRADLLDGEVYDARLDSQMKGWSTPGAKLDETAWATATVLSPRVGRLEAQIEPPARVVQTLKTQKVTAPAPGVQIFDLGQNMVGSVRLSLRAPAGTLVTLRFAEMLSKDGTMFVDNLRSANAIDRYYARGGGAETYEPRFTFHGFRYVEVTGLPSPLPASAVTGLVIASDLPEAGRFATSNALLGKLQSNIVWGQRGNFLSIPTDCPQRDERLGWTGDINMFARTATFNMDAAAFLAKYLIDLEDGQREDGRFPDVAPTVPHMGAGNFAWADVGVMLPWLLYEIYGDTRVLARHYDAAKKWVDFRTAGAKDHLNKAKSFGDWVSPPPQAPNEVIGPIYHAQSARLLGRMAGVLGKREDAKTYEDQFQKIREAFNQAYVRADGTIESDTQTAYILALRYDMLPEDKRAAAVRHLVAAIDRAGKHLATGFLGTGNLLPALSGGGRSDLAYDLLLTDTYPSWLYTVKNGATTMWERWDSYSPETGPSNKGNMNSYNHYAFGAVGEWMYAHVAGIDLDPSAIAWSRVTIKPVVGGGLTHARGEHTTLRGRIVSAWKVQGKTLTLDVEIPVHSTARVYVPAASGEAVKEGGRPASAADGVRFIEMKEGAAVFEVGSGKYRFSTAVPSPLSAALLRR